ncbi:MAG TPA: hypothetical protein VHO67_23015 [Polyangia bacterium]|nr:hypothetical protein [Polyangia bacterium]
MSSRLRRASWLVILCCAAFVAGCGSGGSGQPEGGTGGAAGSPATGGAGAVAGRGGTAGLAGVPGSGGVAGSGGAAGGHGGRGTGGVAGGTAGGGGQAGAGGRSSGGGRGGGGGGGSGGAGRSSTGGTGGLGPEAPGGRVTGYGTVLFTANAKNQITRLQTTLVVPPEPPATGTLFLWPGLQPNGANFDPINNGVLQPVLTWGSSCAPGKQPRAYSTWWISGQYVNTFGNDTGYTGCQGGPIMNVAVGDELNIDMTLAGTVWTQTIADKQTGQSVTYSIDMMNQAQNLSYFVIEEYSAAPISPVVFTDTTITFASADAADCKLTMRGQNDYVAAPVPSTDGISCAIKEIILRAQGIQ